MGKFLREKLPRLAKCLVLAAVFVSGLLVATAREAYAAPQVGDTWYVGDTVDISGYWFVDSDSLSMDKLLRFHCSGAVTLPDNAQFLSGSESQEWYFSDLLPRNEYAFADDDEVLPESGMADLYVKGLSGEKPIGIAIASGDGSLGNPFVFKGVTAKVPKLNTIWYVGDEIDITGCWFVDSDTREMDKLLRFHCSGAVTLPAASGFMSGFGQWYFSSFLPRDKYTYAGEDEVFTESGKEDLNVKGTSNVAPKGVMLVAGDGTHANPLIFEGIYTAPPKAKDLTYNGEDQELVIAGEPGVDWEIQYGLGNESQPTSPMGASIPKGKDAGKYYVWYITYPKEMPIYANPAACIEVTIKKAESSVDPAPEGLKLYYTGKPQELVTAGTANGGTLQYSLDGTNYSESIPEGTDEGEYTIYYKVIGDKNHNDSEAQTVKAVVYPKPTYKCIDGDGSTWTKGSAKVLPITFKRFAEGEEDDTTFSHFESASVDGKALSKNADYTPVEGSVVVNLEVSYLETLSTGEHTLTATFDDGEADATFTVKEEKTSETTVEVTLSYNANGGKGSMDDVVADAGSKVKVSGNKFKRSGYSFSEWNTRKDGTGTSYSKGSSIKLSKDTTLYAQWTKNAKPGTNRNGRPASNASARRVFRALPKTGDPFSLGMVMGLATTGAAFVIAGWRKKR